MNVMINVREIGNGFVVSTNGAINQLVTNDGASSETYYPTEEDLRAAAADILVNALADAKNARARSINEQRLYAARQSRGYEAGQDIQGSIIRRPY